MARNPIHIEYHDELQPLETLLKGVNRAGDFFATGTAEIPMPRLEIEGAGVLSFPVPESQIQEVIRQATRAPYGRGEATILDESVRKVWQLPAERVHLGGKSWTASFDGILKQVVAGLGCQGMKVAAELYKLLVYDPGGFFLAHRDTEKAGGMFGTLVVVLPSTHRGGELVIRHGGREVTVDLSGAEVSEVMFAAFYADCEHEVRPIRDGHRVCLVYNLIQQTAPSSRAQPLVAPAYEPQITQAAALLEANLTGPDAPAKIAWLLEHHYSPDGLAFAGLKAADAARVQVLAQAAARAGCVAHLGIVHIEESGSAEPAYQDYRRRRWGRYIEDDEEDEQADDPDCPDFDVIEVCDARHYVAQWRNQRDEPVPFGEIPLEAGELLPAGALDDEKPDEQRFHEASGNEGASFERSYHRAALVVWRRERYAEVLLQAGVAAALPYLKEKVEACAAQPALPTARQEALALARLLVNAWRDTPSHGYPHGPQPDKRDGMLSLLAELGDATLVHDFIADVVTRDYDGSENQALVAAASLLGAKTTGALFTELARQHLRCLPAECVNLLGSLTTRTRSSVPAEWRESLRGLAEAIVAGLSQIDESAPGDDWRTWQIRKQALPSDARLVIRLLDTLARLEAPKLRDAAVRQLATRPALFDPVTVLVPALEALRAWDAASTRLWEHCAAFLLERSGRPPEAPRDWRQNVKLSCTCPDCRELQQFALDPVEQVHRFRVRQDRRQHLHHQIEHHHLDMTHVTERKGSPQTLVCTKDRRSYQRRCEQYRQDIAALTALAELGGKPGIPAASLQSIATARERAAAWSPA